MLYSEEHFRDRLSTMRAGTRLPKRVVEAMVSYLMETLFMEDPAEVDCMGDDAFLAAVDSCGAFERPTPAPILRTCAAWYASRNTPDPSRTHLP